MELSLNDHMVIGLHLSFQYSIEFCDFIRERGGREAEREERDRWINKERQKIMDSVQGMLVN